jgi:pilus assembly protein CpaB
MGVRWFGASLLFLLGGLPVASGVEPQKPLHLQAFLKPGQRALAVKVTPEGLADGFVLPGTRVDVVARVRQGEKVKTVVVAEDLLVLAVDMVNPRGADPKTPPMTVTLAAYLDEAQKVSNAAAAEGVELRLLLRPPKEK